MSVFRKSLPVLVTSLVNKSGSIGLSLLPILLVEGAYSTAESSLAMSFVKGSTIIATLAAGWLSDTIGLRVTVLWSFLLAAVGFGLLPLQLGFWALLISGVLAQLGMTAINATMRLLLTQTVQRSQQKEALGWMRLVNNLGQVLSFGLATMTATLGARVLIWFDALTSLAAFVIGRRILPRVHDKAPIDPLGKASIGVARSWGPFVGCALLLTGWTFMYELFMAGIAGRLKIHYPVEGLRIFSFLMVLNTLICAALAVVATRVLSQVVPSLVLGVVLTVGGVVLGVSSLEAIPLLFVAVLFLTLGEIIYGALGQFLLIRSVPASRRENTVYSYAILVSNLGRMLAAALAFPLIVHSTSPAWAGGVAIGVGVVSLVVLIVGRRQFTELAGG